MSAIVYYKPNFFINRLAWPCAGQDKAFYDVTNEPDPYRDAAREAIGATKQ